MSQRRGARRIARDEEEEEEDEVEVVQPRGRGSRQPQAQQRNQKSSTSSSRPQSSSIRKGRPAEEDEEEDGGDYEEEGEDDDEGSGAKRKRGGAKSPSSGSASASSSSNAGAKGGKGRKKGGGDDNEFEFGDSKSKRARISDEEREKLLGDLMRLFLFMDHNKHTVRRADITAKVLAEYKGASSRNLLPSLIAEARKRFREIFGFELVELPKPGEPPGTGGSSGAYILVNALGEAERALAMQADSHAPQMGLLMAVQCLIVLSNGVLETDALATYMERLGLPEGQATPVGDWRATIDIFVKEAYLQKTKTDRFTAGGAPVYELRTGPRAAQEVTTKDLLTFIAGVFGDEVDPLQLKELEASARQQAENAEAARKKKKEEQEKAGDEEGGGKGRGRGRGGGRGRGRGRKERDGDDGSD